MRIFDYSFLENGMLPAHIASQALAIGGLKEKTIEKKLIYPTIFTKLESIAKVQSVKCSNAIEGIITTDERIEEIVNGDSRPRNHDEFEILGYRNALELVHTEFETLQISEAQILNLHRILQNFNDEITGGEYKKEDNYIGYIGADGKRHLRFKPTPASQTAEAMEQLMFAFWEARDNYSINNLFLIPCFILDFLCIHPFTDGNGRVSRLLSLLLLYQNGFDAGKYISFEEQINKRKTDYYNALHLSSTNWHEGTNDYFPFMQDFIFTLFMCYKELDKRFAVVGDKKMNALNRIESAVCNSILPISRAELSHILPDIAASTITNVLSKLVVDKKIERLGTFKNARYIKRISSK